MDIKFLDSRHEYRNFIICINRSGDELYHYYIVHKENNFCYDSVRRNNFCHPETALEVATQHINKWHDLQEQLKSLEEGNLSV